MSSLTKPGYLGLLSFIPAFNGTKQALWDFLVDHARTTIRQVLATGLQHGQLIIREGNVTQTFGYPSLKDTVADGEIDIIGQSFWVRVYLTHDLGFAEAFMHGDFKTPNLKAILDLWLENRDMLKGLSSWYSQMHNVFSALALRYFGQNLSNARLNVMTGYDCCNKFFQSFLSEELTYSCAIWPDILGGVRGDLEGLRTKDDLEKAQLHKIYHLLKKARVRTGDRLLEFGSGWGSMAIEAAKLGCTVDTLTLSVQQKKLAEKRIAAFGLSDKVRVHLMDYRQLPAEFEGQFDAFVSVEMVEAVGLRHLPQFFKILDWALKPERAAAVISATTQPESRYSEYQSTDYARRYQWPNSFCPSATSLVTTAYTATGGRFALESLEDYGLHYPRTLREWGRRLNENWSKEIMDALLIEQPQLADEHELQAFKRKWEYMYVYAEVGYARVYTSMHYFTFVRPENPDQKCD